MGEIEQRLEADTQAAAKGRLPELGTLRLLRAALQNEAIARRGQAWGNTEALLVLRREFKKRQEAAKLYEQGGRPELTKQELAEAEIIQRYLPVAPSDEIVAAKAVELVRELKLEGQKGLGPLTKAITEAFAGAVPGQAASTAARQALGLN